MNLVGKIFVVLTFVLALVYMALTMAAYTTVRNWRNVVMLRQEEIKAGEKLGLIYQLERSKHDYEELKNVKDAVQKELDALKASHLVDVSKLETKLDISEKKQKSLEAGRADLEKEKRDAVAAMHATQKNCDDYRAQLEKLRLDLLHAQQDRDKHFIELVKKINELSEALDAKYVLRKDLDASVATLAKAKECLRYNGLNMDSDYKNANPPKVDGIVTGVLDGGLLEISLGSDQGLRKGHLLQVFRTGGGQSTYVGRVEVVKTDPSRAVCKIDPKYQNSNLMVNDRVASTIE